MTTGGGIGSGPGGVAYARSGRRFKGGVGSVPRGMIAKYRSLVVEKGAK